MTRDQAIAAALAVAKDTCRRKFMDWDEHPRVEDETRLEIIHAWATLIQEAAEK